MSLLFFSFSIAGFHSLSCSSPDAVLGQCRAPRKSAVCWSLYVNPRKKSMRVTGTMMPYYIRCIYTVLPREWIRSPIGDRATCKNLPTSFLIKPCYQLSIRPSYYYCVDRPCENSLGIKIVSSQQKLSNEVSSNSTRRTGVFLLPLDPIKLNCPL